jgi:hypothetical protein
MLPKKNILKMFPARCWWLPPVILATWEGEIRRIAVPGQPGQILQGTPSSKQLEQNGLQVWLKQ